MPSRHNKVPSLVHHKPTGQARVRIQGVDIYCGKWGSPLADEKYRRVVAEWLTTGKIPQPGSDPEPAVSVSELILGFWKHAEQHYVKNGRPTDEQHCLKSALKPLRELYGSTSVDEFGPMALKAVRKGFIGKGWCRTYINKSVSRIRLVFRWGVENELVSPITLQALEAVAGLKAGRTTAPDHTKRHPVPDEHIEAVRRVLRLQRPKDLMELQLLTGARPGELIGLTTAMIDRSGDVWVAAIGDHKTAHLGKSRILLFGPRAQLILRRYIDDRAKNKRLFPILRTSYGATVKKACVRAGVPIFTPHWLRHTAATRLREEHGIEVAQVMLGHSKLDMTQHYAAVNVDAAREVARKIG